MTCNECEVTYPHDLDMHQCEDCDLEPVPVCDKCYGWWHIHRTYL